MAQRHEVLTLVSAGASYQQVAVQTGLSYWTVRKWARRGKRGGLGGLVSAYGRPPGLLASFDPLVRSVALRLKRKHPTWGAAYGLKKMGAHESLQAMPLPDARMVWRYWRSFGERFFPQRDPSETKLPRAGVAHGVWQLDFKESVTVAGVGIVTFTQARDEFGGVTVLHRIHPATDEQQSRVKPDPAMVQQDCRLTFTEWGLPDAIQTDRATLFVSDEPTPFPTRLSLWWIGLGINHRLIPVHSPQRNGGVERAHRTLNERPLVGPAFDGPAHWQPQVDADWHELNHACPSRARGCEGLPPLLAHPEFLTPRRPYRPEWELDLFDIQRVYPYLATLTWLRPVSKVGQVSLGGHRYGIGVPFAGQTVSIRFDLDRRQLVFSQVRPDTARGRHLPELALVYRDPIGLSVAELTG